ncbi:MAG: bifunctional alpha,alpha-trehalose-phosphate synthase (UDP-forming)/trehalose-phosphatase [Bacteroidetes bacterium]|jgi:trehalose 6-phosphate synthase/phosphatase|nr:bifunctional alpha,alpha-trehalose-phosphate synthase (UDP-forming)/trehalose-phosphatase [Bacteroidota bacterium]
MKQILIISNRLPVNVTINEGEIETVPSVGGLATGMSSIYKYYSAKWIGWPGLNESDSKIRTKIGKALKKHEYIPVFMQEELFEDFYYGFSNKTIWPLYHYFTQYVEYKKHTWEAYKKVNAFYADQVIENAEEGAYVWVHDYHLQLLPKMLREKRPDLIIGFFLHIPFPSYEVFRILPWRDEIIEGLLGADLIGFHTYDYERHFLSAVRRLRGYDIDFNQVNLDDRFVKVDAFPMGIDYEKFANTAMKHQQMAVKDRSKIQQEIDKHYLMAPDQKLVLSIDRLDYSKGIANRLEAFDYFLDKYPEFKEKVTLVMVATPSRTAVAQYQQMKSEVDELVGHINGKYASINWTPIWYFYRSFPFDTLIDLYTSCDIGLLTPIRDGMNLVAKEFVASKVDQKGVLILSEMAGAAKEMGEALIINPNNYEEIADALNEAMIMPEEEHKEKMSSMQNRLQRYSVEKWARDFVEGMENTISLKEKHYSKNINTAIEKDILSKYKNANKRLLFLDYDGTLVGFQKRPEMAKPDKELLKLLDSLAEDPKNELVIISGRDRETLEKWFKGKPYTLITDHGVWRKEPKEDWQMIETLHADWKEQLRPALEFYVDRTPGSILEEKSFSLAWHYRKVDPELGNMRAIELKDEFMSLIANHNLDILEGNKVIEIKNSGVNKGRAAVAKIGNNKYDFTVAIGDDWTDEYIFEEIPDDTITIKVGIVKTAARFNVESQKDVRPLLKKLMESGG